MPSDSRTDSQPLPSSDTELQLLIERAVFECSPLDRLLPDDTSASVRAHCVHLYAQLATRQLLARCRQITVHAVSEGDAVFIKRFRDAITKKRVVEAFESQTMGKAGRQTPVKQCWKNIADVSSSEQIGRLEANLTSHFHWCCSRFIDMDAEARFRQVLVDYLSMGELTLDLYSQWMKWVTAGCTLQWLKTAKWSKPTSTDTLFGRLQQAIKGIQLSEFLERKELMEVVNVLLAPVKYHTSTETLKLTGAIVFLSQEVKRIEKQLQAEPKLRQVEIYASHVLGVDASLHGALWSGTNLVLASAKVHVWTPSTVDLSGTDTNSKTEQQRARTAADGKHGRAGESSGNLTLLAGDLRHGTRLTVRLNGAAGECGEHGGHGADGVDGEGVSQKELDALCVQYGSMYFSMHDKFYTYTPPTRCNVVHRYIDRKAQYIYAEYKDAKGRKIIYSFAGDLGWIWNSYDLFFYIEGTDGTPGSAGGRNGVGGEGGYRGEFLALDMHTGLLMDSHGVSVHRNMGVSGANGEVGRPGVFGRSGNDWALIDQSSGSKTSKHHIGGVDEKVQLTHANDRGAMQRLDGWRNAQRPVDKYTDKYAQFRYTTHIGNAVQTAMMAEQVSQERCQQKAVCRAAIVSADVFAEMQTVLSASAEQLAHLNTSPTTVASSAAKAEDEAEDEQAESEEVQEQTTVVRDNEPAKAADRQCTFNGQQRLANGPTPSPQQFLESMRWKRHMSDSELVDRLFHLFGVEMTGEQMRQIAVRLILYRSRLKHLCNSTLFMSVVAAGRKRRLGDTVYSHIAAIHQLNANVTVWTVQKRHRLHIADTLNYLHTDGNSGNTAVDMPVDGAHTVYGFCGAGTLPTVLQPHTTAQGIQSLLGRLFVRFQANSAADEMLEQMYIVYQQLRRHLAVPMAAFEQPSAAFNWDDEQIPVAVLGEYWQQFGVKMDDGQDGSSGVEAKETKERATNSAAMDQLLTAIHDNADTVHAAMQHWHKYTNAHVDKKVLVKRFGKVPDYRLDKSLSEMASGMASGLLAKAKDTRAGVKNMFTGAFGKAKAKAKAMVGQKKEADEAAGAKAIEDEQAEQSSDSEDEPEDADSKVEKDNTNQQQSSEQKEKAKKKKKAKKEKLSPEAVRLHQATFLVRFYHQIRTLLEYNMHLYYANVLYSQGTLNPTSHSEQHECRMPALNADMDTTMAQYIVDMKLQSMITKDNDAGEFMKKHGIRSAAYRYLLAHVLRCCVRVYIPLGTGGACQLVECFNQSALSVHHLYCEVLADKQVSVQELVVDAHRWSALERQSAIVGKHESAVHELNTLHANVPPINFHRFIPLKLHPILDEWLV